MFPRWLAGDAEHPLGPRLERLVYELEQVRMSVLLGPQERCSAIQVCAATDTFIRTEETKKPSGRLNRKKREPEIKEDVT